MITSPRLGFPFTGPAYRYIRAGDRLPSYEELAETADPFCRVKVFQPGSRFTYYVAAVTDYEGMVVLTGYCVSPLGADCDEFGDMALAELMSLRAPLGMPPERDQHYTPMQLSEIKRSLADNGDAP